MTPCIMVATVYSAHHTDFLIFYTLYQAVIRQHCVMIYEDLPNHSCGFNLTIYETVSDKPFYIKDL